MTTLVAKGIGFTSVTLNTTGAGALVIITHGAYSGTPTDSKGNTLTLAQSQINLTVSSEYTRAFYVLGTPVVGTSHTFTVSAAIRIEVLAFDTLTSFEAATSFCPAAAGVTGASGSLTPGGANRVMISAIGLPPNTTGISVDSGYTISDAASGVSGTSYGGGAAYLIDAPVSAINPTWTWTAPTNTTQPAVHLAFVGTSAGDTTAPTITSSATFSVAENTSTVSTLTANETVTWAKTGGADQALFTLNSSTGALSFTAAPDFEAPADADTNNVYVVQVTATDAASNASTPQTISVTVTDVADTPGVLDTAAVKLGSWVGSGASLTFAHDVGVSYRAEVYASGLVLGNAILTLAARNTGTGGVYGADISSLSLAVGTDYEVVFTNQATGQKSAPYKLAAHA